MCAREGEGWGRWEGEGGREMREKGGGRNWWTR